MLQHEYRSTQENESMAIAGLPPAAEALGGIAVPQYISSNRYELSDGILAGEAVADYAVENQHQTPAPLFPYNRKNQRDVPGGRDNRRPDKYDPGDKRKDDNTPPSRKDPDDKPKNEQ